MLQSEQSAAETGAAPTLTLGVVEIDEGGLDAGGCAVPTFKAQGHYGGDELHACK